MLTEEHIKEGLSQAYVLAIVNKAGMDCGLNSTQFDYGIDGSIIDVKITSEGKRSTSGFKIDFQLKSSVNIQISDDEVTYSLRAKNYNDLVDTEIGTPRILILFYLPRNPSEWVTVTEQKLELRNCAWWYSLYGKKPTSNSSTVNINIPKDQILTVEEVNRLMNLVKEGNKL